MMSALLSLGLIGFTHAATWEKVSIYLNGSDALDIKTGVLDKSADVEAYFIDSMEQTGWGLLQVNINNINNTINIINNNHIQNDNLIIQMLKDIKKDINQLKENQNINDAQNGDYL